jgi:2-polyprenyl-6-methoxyphenol hydroxylase-like FAD-dependent oxidoreductase
VTLLGDAAYLMMAPFTGVGTNLAMGDSADRGFVLAEAKTPFRTPGARARVPRVQCKSTRKKIGGDDGEHGYVFER